MKKTINIPEGIVGNERFIVTYEDTIAGQVSEDLPQVLGTFILTKWMEQIAGYMVQSYLLDGDLTVGAQIDIEHVAPSPVGMNISIESSLIKVDGISLHFNIVAYDDVELIARAKHKRTVISRPLLERIIKRKSGVKDTHPKQ